MVLKSLMTDALEDLGVVKPCVQEEPGQKHGAAMLNTDLAFRGVLRRSCSLGLILILVVQNGLEASCHRHILLRLGNLWLLFYRSRVFLI